MNGRSFNNFNDPNVDISTVCCSQACGGQIADYVEDDDGTCMPNGHSPPPPCPQKYQCKQCEFNPNKPLTNN